METKFNLKKLMCMPEHKYTATEISKGTGIPYSTVSHWINRPEQVRSVQLTYLTKLKRFFELDSIDDLLEQTDQQPLQFTVTAQISNNYSLVQYFLINAKSAENAIPAKNYDFILELRFELYDQVQVLNFSNIYKERFNISKQAASNIAKNHLEDHSELISQHLKQDDIAKFIAFEQSFEKTVKRELQKATVAEETKSLLNNILASMPDSNSFKVKVKESLSNGQFIDSIATLKELSNSDIKNLLNSLIIRIKLDKYMTTPTTILQLPEINNKVTRAYLKISDDQSNHSQYTLQRFERNQSPYSEPEVYVNPDEWITL